MPTPIAFDDMEFQLQAQRDIGPFLTKPGRGWHFRSKQSEMGLAFGRITLDACT